MPLRLAQFIIRHDLPIPGGWWLEVWSGMTLIIWALWTWWLGSAVVNHQENYRVAISILSQYEWEVLSGGIGVSQVFTAFFLQEFKWTRAVICFTAAIFIFLLTYSLFAANNNLLGLPVHIGWGTANICALLLLFRRNGMKAVF